MSASASALLRELSEPWGSGEKTKCAIDRAARLAHLKYWRAFDIWYRKARQVEDFEVDQIREALRIKNEKDARDELRDLKLRLARLEARLSAEDADFHRPSIDFASDHVGGRGRVGRSANSR